MEYLDWIEDLGAVRKQTEDDPVADFVLGANPWNLVRHIDGKLFGSHYLAYYSGSRPATLH